MSDPPFNPPRVAQLRRRPANAATTTAADASPGQGQGTGNSARIPVPLAAEIAADEIDESFSDPSQMTDEEIRARGCIDVESYVANASAERRIVAIASGAKGKEIPKMESSDEHKYETTRRVFPGAQYVYVQEGKHPLGRIDVPGMSFHDFIEHLRNDERFYNGEERTYRCLFFTNGAQRAVFYANLRFDPIRKAEYDAKVRAIQAGTYVPPGQGPAPQPAASAPPPFPGTAPAPGGNDEAIKAYREMADRERRRAEEAAAAAAAAQREAAERLAALERRLAALTAAPPPAAPALPPPAALAGPPQQPPAGVGPPDSIELLPGHHWGFANGKWRMFPNAPAPTLAALAAPPPPPAPAAHASPPVDVDLLPGHHWGYRNGKWCMFPDHPGPAQHAPAAPPPPVPPAPPPAAGPSGTGWGVLGELASGVQRARSEIERVAPALGLSLSPPASAVAHAAPPAPAEKEEEKPPIDIKPRTAKMGGLDIPVSEDGAVEDLNMTTVAMNLPNLIEQAKMGYQFMSEQKKQELLDALAAEEKKNQIEKDKRDAELAAKREAIALEERQLALLERKSALAAQQQRLIREAEIRAASGYQPAPSQLSGLPDEPPPPAPQAPAAPPPPAPLAPSEEGGYDF